MSASLPIAAASTSPIGSTPTRRGRSCAAAGAASSAAQRIRGKNAITSDEVSERGRGVLRVLESTHIKQCVEDPISESR